MKIKLSIKEAQKLLVTYFYDKMPCGFVAEDFNLDDPISVEIELPHKAAVHSMYTVPDCILACLGHADMKSTAITMVREVGYMQGFPLGLPEAKLLVEDAMTRFAPSSGDRRI